jgi:hypothetical protein
VRRVLQVPRVPWDLKGQLVLPAWMGWMGQSDQWVRKVLRGLLVRLVRLALKGLLVPRVLQDSRPTWLRWPTASWARRRSGWLPW